jgi:hypothetical protein
LAAKQGTFARLLAPLLRQERIRGGGPLIGTTQVDSGKAARQKVEKKIKEKKRKEAIVDEMIDELIVDDGMMRPITSSKRDTSRHLHPAKADKHVKVSSQQTYLICTLVRVPMYSRHVWMAEADTVF